MEDEEQVDLALKMIQNGRSQINEDNPYRINEDKQLKLAVWISKVVRGCPNLSDEMI